MAIVVAIPDEDKFLVPAFTRLLTLLEQVRTQSAGPGNGHSIDYGRVEREVAAAVAQVECAAHQGLLQALDVDAPALLIGGKKYEQVEQKEDLYFTMAGPCLVRRSLYREQGRPESSLVAPVSLRAGVLLEGWLPQTATAMAHQVQQATAREAQETARITQRLPYSDSSFERVAHAVGTRYVKNEAEVEQKLIEAYVVAPEVSGVCVSLDRVSLPMEEPCPGAPHHITRAYRMAFCGTVTLHDGNGKAVHTIRYGRMPNDDALGLVEAMASDVDALRQQRPDLKVTSLADGASDLWSLLDTYFNDASVGTAVVRLIDLWHNLEKLGKAARLIHGPGGSEQVLSRWKLSLLNDSGAAHQILAELLASGRRQVRLGDTRPVHEAITYLENHADQMNYAQARQEGRPVGSGIVEATCKSLVEVRMKRSGARWKTRTGAHIIRLRALGLSHRWDEAMLLLLAPLQTAVQRAA